jgi:tetrapyrrole methylase family protein / MazG family protein
MPLLVVPLAIEEVDLLTLGEWERLSACRRVYFERPDHPLADRLRAIGVECGPFDDEPSATLDGTALVGDPGSTRVVELAKQGAQVTAGPVDPPDALSAALAAPVVRRAAAELGRAATVMARLRSADGCPWDIEQTHDSLKVHLLEEAHEVIEAIDRAELDTGLEEELGDILLQVLFHARIAEQDGRFDVAEVADRLSTKLIGRHPHVFGDSSVRDAAHVVERWESLKRAEKDREGPFDDIPRSLPALLAAYKTQKRAAAVGFSTDAEEAEGRARAALDEGAIGDALFWVVALARARGLDPETALLERVARFRAEQT